MIGSADHPSRQGGGREDGGRGGRPRSEWSATSPRSGTATRSPSTRVEDSRAAPWRRDDRPRPEAPAPLIARRPARPCSHLPFREEWSRVQTLTGPSVHAPSVDAAAGARGHVILPCLGPTTTPVGPDRSCQLASGSIPRIASRVRANSGSEQTVQWLQSALGCVVDHGPVVPDWANSLSAVLSGGESPAISSAPPTGSQNQVEDA